MDDGTSTEKLISLHRRPDFSLYRIDSDYAPHLKRYIVSTPETREILNHPEIVGFNFTSALKTAVSRIMAHFPEPSLLAGVTDLNSNVFHFLRGGLNFGIGEALHESLSFNLVSSSFMTSQRDMNEEGRWYIKEDQYQKFTFSRNSTVFCGDIVATGSTIINGIDRLFRISKNSGKPVKNMIFFTVGCHKVEKIFEHFHRLFEEHFKNYGNTFIFYIEGKFKLADSQTDLEIKVQGTDLLRHPALLAPEFELSQYETLTAPMERCAIYDGGTRKFDVEVYCEDVISYWRTLMKLAQEGWTLERAYRERWPETEYDLLLEEFKQYKAHIWEHVPARFLEDLYRVRLNRWNADFKKRADTSQALIELCKKRIESLLPKPIPFRDRPEQTRV